MQIANDAVLTNINGLINLTSVGGGLSIKNNASLTNLLGLTNLASVESLNFYGNASLTSLDGLANITNVGGHLSITWNAALTSLDGLANLTYVGGILGIRLNASLTNLDGLARLNSVVDNLEISTNPNLSNLDGLSGISVVNNSLNIDNNAALTSLDGLSNITSVVGRLSIWDNASLITLNGLSGLTSVGGTLAILDNPKLSNLEGLSSIVSVGGTLFIGRNPALTSLNGLPKLTSVGGLDIRSNPALTSLDGLTNLTSVGGLLIQDNAALTNVDGLSNLASVGWNVYIQFNQILDQCTGLSQLVDQWDDAEPGPGPGYGGFPDIGGGVSIEGNLSGCNSVEEILATVNPFKINSGLNDAWYAPETSGQGFFITVFPDLGYVSLAWFTYDTELPPIDATANLGDPGHRWITAVGPIEGNQVLMDIEMTSGGLFDTATEITRTDPPGSDGTIVLTFDSCNSGMVEYDIPSINKQGTIPIQRVANDNIALCEALNSNLDQPLFPAR